MMFHFQLLLWTDHSLTHSLTNLQDRKINDLFFFFFCWRFFYAHLPLPLHDGYGRGERELWARQFTSIRDNHQLLFKIKLTCLICPLPGRSIVPSHFGRRDAPKTFTLHSHTHTHTHTQRGHTEMKNRKALLIASMPISKSISISSCSWSSICICWIRMSKLWHVRKFRAFNA